MFISKLVVVEVLLLVNNSVTRSMFLTLHVLGTHQPTLSGHHESLLMIKICLNNTQHLDLSFERILVSFPE